MVATGIASQRRAVGGDLGEGEVAERQDAGVADERLQAEHQQQVDEQLLHEQVAGRAAGRRVDEGADHEGDEQHARCARRAASDGSHPLRRVHGEQTLRADDEQGGDEHEDEGVGQPLPRALREVPAQQHLGDAEARPPTTAPVKLPRPPMIAATTALTR